MIYYFSGTGNTKFVADCLADKLNDEVTSMNELTKKGGTLSDSSKKPVIFAAPIYAWRFPLAVEKLLKSAKLNGSKKAYFVATCESQYGKTDKYLRKICEEISAEYMGFAAVFMPNNYPLGGEVATAEESETILQKAVARLGDIADTIRSGKQLIDKEHTPLGGLMSGAVNSAMYKFMVTSKNFVVSDNCVSCGRCERVCPMGNIKMQCGKPMFGDKCTWCFGCIEYCPKQAINIKGKTESKRRNVCPEYSIYKKNHLK